MHTREIFLYACIGLIISLTFAGVACQSSPDGKEAESSVATTDEAPSEASGEPSESNGASSEERSDKQREVKELPDVDDPSLAQATFAGGCFWCMEPPFDKLEGVEATIVGYTGGEREYPTYDEVSRGATDHLEAIRVIYDPSTVSYQTLVDVFWHNIDPTQDDGQFVDIGDQYRTAIFYHDERQKKLAEFTKEGLAEEGPFDEPIVTEIRPAETFWRAEDYHQNFYRKKPERYESYRSGSGRDAFLRETWGEKPYHNAQQE